MTESSRVNVCTLGTRCISVTLVSLHALSFDESHTPALSFLHNKSNRQSFIWEVWSLGGNLRSHTCECECEVLASLWHTYLGSFFLDPKDVRRLSVGAVCNIRKGTGLLWLGHQIVGNKGPSHKVQVCLERKESNTLTVICNSILFSLFCYFIFYPIHYPCISFEHKMTFTNHH